MPTHLQAWDRRIAVSSRPPCSAWWDPSSVNQNVTWSGKTSVLRYASVSPTGAWVELPPLLHHLCFWDVSRSLSATWVQTGKSIWDSSSPWRIGCLLFCWNSELSWLIGYRRISSHPSKVCFPASSGFPGSGCFHDCVLLMVNLPTYCPESLTDVPCINRAAAAAQWVRAQGTRWCLFILANIIQISK